MARRKPTPAAPQPPTAPPPTADAPPPAELAAPPADPDRAGPADDRLLLQDWTPLGQCLTQRIGRQYWPAHAAELFANETVPHWVHDNGALSRRTAQVFLAWCAEQAAAERLPAQIVVCEFGMGTGLHLRYFLDAVREDSRAHGRDWYDRLAVLASDVSAPVARNAQERGLFADHAPRVRLGFADIESPEIFVELDTGAVIDLRGRVHFAIAYYVLDLLSVDVFRRRQFDDGPRWDAVWVRTWLRDLPLLPGYCELTAEQLQQLAADSAAADLEPLAQAWTLLQEQLRAWPVTLQQHPDAAELAAEADAQERALGADHPLLADGTVVVHSAGALRAVQLLAGTLAEAGAIALRDVGLASAEAAATARGLTHYGQVTAAAVNWAQADRWLPASAGLRVTAPDHDGDRGQCSRLVSVAALPQTEAAFRAAFDSGEVFASHEMVARAAGMTDPAEALEQIRLAIAREPTDWTLHLDAARMALDGLGRADVAHVIALRAVELNPAYSPDLWCVLGDALHAQGMLDGSRRAYANALAIYPRHARSLWSAAYVDAERGRHGAAFELLGLALRCDRDGRWRPQILQLLDTCLRAQTLQRQAELARLAEQAAL